MDRTADATEDDLDGCDLDFTQDEPAADEDLPAAAGGVEGDQ